MSSTAGSRPDGLPVMAALRVPPLTGVPAAAAVAVPVVPDVPALPVVAALLHASSSPPMPPTDAISRPALPVVEKRWRRESPRALSEVDMVLPPVFGRLARGVAAAEFVGDRAHLRDPHVVVAEDVLDDPLEHLHPVGSPDDLRVHGEHVAGVVALLVHPVEVAPPDLLDLGGTGQAGEPVGGGEHELGRVGELPRAGDLGQLPARSGRGGPVGPVGAELAGGWRRP